MAIMKLKLITKLQLYIKTKERYLTENNSKKK